MKFTRRARYNGSSRSKRIAFCSRAPRPRQFRSQAARERCGARIYPRASRHKSRFPSFPFRVYVPKRVAKIRPLAAAGLRVRLPLKKSPKDLRLSRSWPAKVPVSDCKDARREDPKLWVFKDLKQRNTELFPSKSPRRVPFYTFRFYARDISERTRCTRSCKCPGA